MRGTYLVSRFRLWLGSELDLARRALRQGEGTVLDAILDSTSEARGLDLVVGGIKTISVLDHLRCPDEYAEKTDGIRLHTFFNTGRETPVRSFDSTIHSYI